MKASGEIKGGTLKRAVSHIAQAFRNEGLSNPSRDCSGKTHHKIEEIYKTYSHEDPPVVRKPPLPMSFFKGLKNLKSTPLSEAIGQVQYIMA